MTPPSLPIFSGQGWSLHKKPKFATIVASHASGREVRSPLYQTPLWEFEATFDGLSSDLTSYPGLGGQSLQSLLGLFLQCQGQLGAFTFMDPTDYAVAGQAFGVGDGATVSFLLNRTLGGFSEPIGLPFVPTVPTIVAIPPGPGGTPTFAPNNVLSWSSDIANAAWTKASLGISSGVLDPFGGAGAQTLTATAAAGFASQTQTRSGFYANSVWLRRRIGGGAITVSNPGNTVNAPMAVTASWRRFNTSGTDGLGSVAFQVTLATSGDAIDVYGPQQEAATTATPGAYFATKASLYFGAPWITVAGSLVDPSGYAISANVVTFAAAPASGVLLNWTGWFSFLCRFLEDDTDFENFMQNLWAARSVKFKSVRTS